MRYTISSNGLEKQKTTNTEIVPGKLYWMGASSSPSMVLVTDITTSGNYTMVHWTKVYNAEWKESPIIQRTDKWIFVDLVARAEVTIAKDARQTKQQYGASDNPFNQLMVKATENRTRYIGGKAYTFKQEHVCNCCGDECEVIDNRSNCCQSDYRSNQDATRLIK